MSPDQMARIRNTGVPMDFLKEVVLAPYKTMPKGDTIKLRTHVYC